MRSDPSLLHPSRTRSAPRIYWKDVLDELEAKDRPPELPLPDPPKAKKPKKAKQPKEPKATKAKEPKKVKEPKRPKSKKAKQPKKHRRRPGPSVIAVAAVVLALLGADRPLARPGIEVSLETAGASRLVRIPQGTTAAAAFIRADAIPRTGRLLSVATKTVLDAEYAPPGYAINGVPATPSTVVHSGARVTALEYPDEIEPVTDLSEPIPAPPLPPVEHELWHPGRDGTSVVTKGTISGEETHRNAIVQPVAPAPVTAPLVSLTFDDGPWHGSERFLDVLKEKNVKAMFCVVGYTMGRAGYADIVKRAVAEGHSLCNHTVSHDIHLPQKPPDRINAEIHDANTIIGQRVGAPKPLFYRPPGGQLSQQVIDIAHQNGHRVLKWTVDPGDYAAGIIAPDVFGRVMAGLKPGAVILLHDGGGDQFQTLVALGTLIDHIRAAGYQFTVPDQIAPVA